MLFEVLSEEGLGGEIEFVGHLLDAEAGVFEERFGLEDDVFVDPLGGGSSGESAHERGHVFRCDVHAFGIETDAPFPQLVVIISEAIKPSDCIVAYIIE